MNLFTSKKYYSDNGVCSFHEFARELDEDYLRTQVNGGDCGGGAPSPSPSAQGSSGSPGGSGSGGGTGHGTGGTSSSGATTTPQAPAVNPGASETQNPGYTGGGGNYEPPKEVMSNPQAYAYWLSLQDKAMKEGDPGKYKDYNIVPDYKQNIVKSNQNSEKEKKNGYEVYIKAGYALTENIGFNISGFKTDWYIDSKTNELNILTQANFSQKNNADSFEFFGNVSLYVDGKQTDIKNYKKLTPPYMIWLMVLLIKLLEMLFLNFRLRIQVYLLVVM